MKEIQLTKGYVALVDDSDYATLNAFKWHVIKGKHTYYAARDERNGGKRRYVYMHREVMNAPKGMQVDHMNGEGLDNRKSNLRLCTNKENSRSIRHMPKNNTSGHLGVSWNMRESKWKAAIMVDYKTIYLGLYSDIKDAVAARKAADIKYFGDFKPNI